MRGSWWYRIRKGQSIMIPINLINRDTSIWGEDATEFKLVLFFYFLYFQWLSDMFFFFFSRPERWANIPNAATSVPGVWSNILSFIGGPRACIGFRFSLVEWVLSFSFDSFSIVCPNYFFKISFAYILEPKHCFSCSFGLLKLTLVFHLKMWDQKLRASSVPYCSRIQKIPIRCRFLCAPSLICNFWNVLLYNHLLTNVFFPFSFSHIGDWCYFIIPSVSTEQE